MTGNGQGATGIEAFEMDRIMLKLIRAFAIMALAGAAALSATPARAQELVWNINAVFADGSTVTGFVTYDVGAAQYTDWRVTTASSQYVYGISQDDADPNFDPNNPYHDGYTQLVFVGNEEANGNFLQLSFGGDLRTGAPSTLAILNGFESDDQGDQVFINSGNSANHAILAGSETATPMPEPGSLAILGTGILLLGSGLRRRLPG